MSAPIRRSQPLRKRRLGHAHLGERLSDERDLKLIAPHHRERSKPQDGMELRRYRRSSEVERFFASLHCFRRLVIRYERKAENFLGILRLLAPHSPPPILRWALLSLLSLGLLSLRVNGGLEPKLPFRSINPHLSLSKTKTCAVMSCN